MAASKPILISGAGLSGLLLARSLRTSKIPFLLYERDTSINARAQGYRLRISSEGMGALKEVLSADEYEKLHSGTAITGGGGIHNLDATTGEPRAPLSEGGSGGGPKLGGDVLGVSRAFLRQCLFEGQADELQWGNQVVGYSSTDSGVVLKFADGSTSPEGSMLVAADGPHSSIARQLTDGKVRSYDTGARMIHGQTPARAFKQLGDGVWSVMDESNPDVTLSLITNVRPGSLEQEDLELGWVFVGSPGTFNPPGNDFSIVGKAAADISRTLTAKWHNKIQPIFQQQNDAEAAFLKMSTANPEGVPEWTNSPRVTLMGDAVHCMTPAGGVGANTALKDAAFVGRLLKRHGGWWDGMTKEYEEEMRKYASPNVKMSFEASSERFRITELK